MTRQPPGEEKCFWCGAKVIWIRPYLAWQCIEPDIAHRHRHRCDPAAYRRRMEEIGTDAAHVRGVVDGMIAEANLRHARRWSGSVEVKEGVAGVA